VSNKIFLTLRRDDADIRRRFGNLQSLADVAELLEIPPRYLRKILYRRADRAEYRKFDLRKRSGGTRSISAPPAALAILQSKLNHVLNLVYRQKKSAHGFIPGRSILTNAEPHVGKRWVFNVDLKDFFPSINFGRVRGVLIARPYAIPAKAATIIAQLCTNDNQLPQGAPSSPMLSNLVCAKLDGDLEALAKRHRLTYTRYCDDLTFSARAYAFPPEIGALGKGPIGGGAVIGDALRAVIEGNGFTPNDQKTRLQFRDCHQEVTGLIVNKFLNVRRSLVAEVRAMVHAWGKFGLENAAAVFVREYAGHEYHDLSEVEAFRLVLKGKLEYIANVRGPADFVYARLRTKLHGLDSELIGPAPTELTQPRSRFQVVAGVNWQRHYARVSPSVRQIQITVADGTVKSGTAFALRPNMLGTALHNLIGRVSIAEAGQLQELHEAILHPVHAASVDCAILPFNHGFEPLQIETRLPEEGEPVAAIGFATIPQRLPVCGVYAGQMEAKSVGYRNAITYLQVSLPGAGGLSGSPVVNRAGRVIGVIVESVFEETKPDVPNREFLTVLPIGYLTSIPNDAPRSPIPVAN
jgi:RNA-directed DNA polymerase